MDEKKKKDTSISDLLKHGKKNGISAARLADMLGTTTRRVGHIIEAARREGELICSGSAGYYLPASRKELEETYKNMRARSLSMLFTIGKMKKALEEWGEPEEEET